jgi:hypothetical protein
VETANVEGYATTINEKRVSDNLLNVQTETQIQSLLDANIADAVGRVPRVTLKCNDGWSYILPFLRWNQRKWGDEDLI